MQETGNNPTKISVQIGLNGFSYTTDNCARSSWLSAEFVFNTDVFQKRYDKIELSCFTPKFCLVPSAYFSEEKARELLAESVSLEEGDEVGWRELESAGAVEIYSLPKSRLAHIISGLMDKEGCEMEILPELHYLLRDAYQVEQYNKIAASYADGRLYLVIYQGKNLVLCSSYQAPDFTTAQYYIFLAIRKLQMNIEASAIYFRTPLQAEEELSLYNYFKAVKSL